MAPLIGRSGASDRLLSVKAKDFADSSLAEVCSGEPWGVVTTGDTVDFTVEGWVARGMLWDEKSLHCEETNAG